MVAAMGITLVSLADTIATSSSFGARRGEEVDPNQEMIGIGAANLAVGRAPGLRRVDQRLADRRRRASGRQDPAGLRRRAPAWSPSSSCSSTPCWPTCPSRRSPQSSSAPHFSCWTSTCWSRYARVRKSALVLSVIASLGVIVLGVLQGIVIAVVAGCAAVLPPGLATARCGSRAGSDPIGGWHNVDALSRRPRATRDRGLPVGGTTVLRQLFVVPHPGQKRRAVTAAVLGRRPVRGDHRHRRLRRQDARAARPRAQRTGIHMAFVEMRTRLQDLVQRYGLFETLDGDRFYPTLDTGLVAIRGDVGPSGTSTTPP